MRGQVDHRELGELTVGLQVSQELFAGVGAEEDVLAVEQRSDGLDLAASGRRPKAEPRVRRSRSSPSRWARIASAAGLVSNSTPNRPGLSVRLSVSPSRRHRDGDSGHLGVGGLNPFLKLAEVGQLGPVITQ